jgi:DNA-binding transcriptional MerR regulator
VRTLHYYDELGLLTPSARSEAGYRLYDAADIARLHQIRSLRQLGFPLQEIRSLLNGSGVRHEQVLDAHLRRLREQRDLLTDLIARLESMQHTLHGGKRPAAEEFLRTLEAMSVMDRVNDYYTPEQRAQIEERGRLLGEDRIREVEAEWPRLIEEMRGAMRQGKDPSSPEVQALARRWKGLVEEFTGGDPGITESLRRMYANEPSVRQMSGIDEDLGAYVGRAMEAMK